MGSEDDTPVEYIPYAAFRAHTAREERLHLWLFGLVLLNLTATAVIVGLLLLR